MRRFLALLLTVSLFACSEDPVETPDAGTSDPVDGGTDEQKPDGGKLPADGGSGHVIGFAQLEGPKSRKLLIGGSTEIGVLVYLAGVTEGDGAGAGIEVDVGYGAAGAQPSTFTFSRAQYAGDADGLSPKANDRYTLSLSPPAGVWDVAARVRCQSCEVKELFVDLNWSQPDYDPLDALSVTVTEASIGWCSIKAPTAIRIARIDEDRLEAQIFGAVFAEGLTEAPGAAAGIVGEIGVGPENSDPRTASGWTWTESRFDAQEGNNDLHVGAFVLSPVTNAAFAYRFTLAGSTIYCDNDGNDGSPTGFDPANIGKVERVVPVLDYGQLEGSATVTVASTLDVSGLVYSAGLTEGAGQGAGIAVEFGYGETDSDPATHASWKWTPAGYLDDADGLTPGDKANDRYAATLQLPEGTWDVAMRARVGAGAWIVIDRDGSTNGYAPASAMKVTVAQPKVDWCRLLGPASASGQLGRMQPVNVTAQVWAQGLTDATSGAAPAGLEAEVGFGAAGSDPANPAGWIWTSGAYRNDQGNDDVFEGSVSPAAVGEYALAFRFRIGTGDWHLCDLDGNDGTAGGFDPAALGALSVTAPRVDFAELEGAQQRTLESGGTATVSLIVYADGITTGAGQGAGVTVEVGYGAPGTDPSDDPSWRWSPAAYEEDADGLFPNDLANDRYEGALTPPDGSYDAAARVKLGSGEWVHVDLNGSDGGYSGSDAIKLAVNPPAAITWAQLRAISPVENVGAKLLASGEVYAPGITDSAGQGAGISAEIGIGPRGSDPRSATGWTWVAASYLGDAPGGGTQSNDTYGAWLTAPAEGQYSVAMRFDLGGTSTWVDRDGTTPFGVAELAPLDTFPEGGDIGWCNIQSPGNVTHGPGTVFQIWAQVWIPGATDANGQPVPGLVSQVAVGPDGTDPRSADGWSWSDASVNGAWDFGQNNDEHVGTLTAPQLSGGYRYAVRFRLNAGWTYCDADSANGGFDAAQLPTLTVP